MKSNRKAQGAMEYLMTYGWAIIVVMIVGENNQEKKWKRMNFC